jgi:hypothetical protein
MTRQVAMGAIIGFVITALATVLWRDRAAVTVAPVPEQQEGGATDVLPRERTPADVKKRVNGALHDVPFDQMRAK